MILPCYNEEIVLKAVKLKRLMDGLKVKEEISDQSKMVFVDDGSVDSTWEILEQLCEAENLFEAICLAHNREIELYVRVKKGIL